jgi:hypothetical protein
VENSGSAKMKNYIGYNPSSLSVRLGLWLSKLEHLCLVYNTFTTIVSELLLLDDIELITFDVMRLNAISQFLEVELSSSHLFLSP